MHNRKHEDSSRLLSTIAPGLARILKRSMIYTEPVYTVPEIRHETVMVPSRDGVRLATDLYLPPLSSAPTVAIRTPYGRATDGISNVANALARRGYVVASQDLRGTGDSEPNHWNYYLEDVEDSYDFIEWISKQPWFDGFVGSCGGSYVGQTQWQMALHPKMSTIVPDVSGLGTAVNTLHLHLGMEAYARSVGNGAEKLTGSDDDIESLMLDETLATGFYNEPLHKPFSDALLARFPNIPDLPPMKAKRWLWEQYCALDCAGRVELAKQATGAKYITNVEVESLSSVFGQQITHDAHTVPHPDPDQLVSTFHAPVLLRTGWYDWGINDAFATWDLLMRSAPEPMRSNCRLFIGPNSHNTAGYHEGMEGHPELLHGYGIYTTVEVLLRWYETVRKGTFASWPRIIYYLMGANEWRAADAWPIPGTKEKSLYLGPAGSLSASHPNGASKPDSYLYDPNDPTPTIGGSILSNVYPPGSVDVQEVQKRTDVLVYTTDPLEQDLDVVGKLRLVLYASSSAVDTDFFARLSDVFPDGRAIQLQNCGLRVRFRNPGWEPELLEPGRVYKFEIDMWATSNRFKAGHRLRLDISSADFPRLDRNANLGGEPGAPISATQTIFHDAEHPSHLQISILDP